MPNEKRVTNIQNPSQTGLRTQGDGHFRTHGAAVAISTTAAGEESSAIRAIAECAVGGALRFIYQATPLFLELRSRDEVVCGGADGGDDLRLVCGQRHGHDKNMVFPSPRQKHGVILILLRFGSFTRVGNNHRSSGRRSGCDLYSSARDNKFSQATLVVSFTSPHSS